MGTPMLRLTIRFLALLRANWGSFKHLSQVIICLGNILMIDTEQGTAVLSGCPVVARLGSLRSQAETSLALLSAQINHPSSPLPYMASETPGSPSSSGSFVGVLDLHIIEATDLPGGKKLKVDKLQPYVTARLESKESSKQSTLAAKAVRGWIGGPTMRR
jgi:hypothetical protein